MGTVYMISPRASPYMWPGTCQIIFKSTLVAGASLASCGSGGAFVVTLNDVGRRFLIFGMLVPLFAAPGSAQPPTRVTEAEVRDALKDVEDLATHLNSN